MGYSFSGSEPSATLTWIHVLILVLLLSIINVGNSQDAQILKSPRPQNVFLRSEATFYCDAIADFGLIWRVNGENVFSSANSVRGITPSISDPDPDTGIINSTLTIPATEINDNIAVQCAVSSAVESDEVVLLIQGSLDPVSELRCEPRGNFLKILTWTPPFTLNVTDFEPDITYTVCTNYTNTVQTTNTSHVFPTPCFPVEYSVSACNPVGCSENSTIHIAVDFVQVPTTIMNINREFMYQGSSLAPMMEFLVQYDGNCTYLYEANFTGELNSANVIEPQPFMPTVDFDGTHRVVLMEEDGIVENEQFTGALGMRRVMTATSFTTFDVQRVTTRPEGGSILVRCMFATGSPARGCRVFVNDLSGGAGIPSMDALRVGGAMTSSTTFTGLQNGTYAVFVLDIEADGDVVVPMLDDIDRLFREFVRITDAPPPTPPPTSSVASLPYQSPTKPTGSSGEDSSAVYAGAGVGAAVIAIVTVGVIILIPILVIRNKKGHGKVSRIGSFRDSPTESFPPVEFALTGTRGMVRC